jgi:hypothetical protein
MKNLKPRPRFTDYESNIKPIWIKPEGSSPYSIMVATPVHSDVSIHYTQALLELQKECMRKKIGVQFVIMKSSLVTHGRNLCVASFLSSDCTHLLFVDSDIDFQASSIFKMIEKDKEVMSIPYPLKTMMWDKGFDSIKNGEIKTEDDLKRSMNTYPMKVENPKDIIMDKGVIEVTHSPTGCMLIKRNVFEKMIIHYPDRNVIQKTVINGKFVDKPNFWNFFDCLHDPVTKTYMGEDFAFCKLWKDIGGKCYAYIADDIWHIGEHQYMGKFADELINNK